MMSNSKDATGHIVVRMVDGNGPSAWTVVGIHDDPDAAQQQAERRAREDGDGALFGVYSKTGTARLVSNVEWREPGQ